ncbi:o-succinylbenzoate synthase [Actinoplanes sp. NPDC024001]|uniref:o-succinylbenzoate synthase n=1 Tax=Actinoplanes sp. NPDC024001 TaxID=3154598 RepID=UPI0033CD9D7E
MKVDRIELHHVRLPLVAPFQTSFATEHDRDALLVMVRTPDGDGWGECVAMQTPCYSAEYLDGTVHVLREFLIPLLRKLPVLSAEAAGEAFTEVKGHPMAKAALETAILDAQLQTSGTSLADYLAGGKEHRERVPAGVSVGIMPSLRQLLEAVDGYLAAGYQRIKLKIQPGWDVEPVRAVREKFGAVPLQVDANGAYTKVDAAAALKPLDEFDLLMVEQPLADDDLWGHAELARRLNTRICLDESITSPADAVTAIRMRAAAIINIKPGRVGGYLQAKRIHDICRQNDVPVWVGGMLETGVGRAANLALASLPNFRLVGDLSASDRFFERDITPPFVMTDGHINVPTAPGIGVKPFESVTQDSTPVVIRF